MFDVDMRLRPSGSKGPVASQFRGFVAYHDQEAELWEHMALTRARPLAGDPGLSREVQEAITGLLARPRDRRRVFREVAAMRQVIEREKGEGDGWDLKIAPGGLIDLDFLAQALVLAHASERPDLVGLPTPAVFPAASMSGHLDPADAATLADGFRRRAWRSRAAGAPRRGARTGQADLPFGAARAVSAYSGS